MCAHVFEKIKYLKALNFTTDIWSSDVSPVSLLSLTADLLDEKNKCKHSQWTHYTFLIWHLKTLIC